MGLTFQQQFYYVPDDVFVMITPQGHIVGILEIPEDENEALMMKKYIEDNTSFVLNCINFDKLIKTGFKYEKAFESFKKNIGEKHES